MRFYLLQSLACGPKLRLEVANGGSLCAEDGLLVLELALLFFDCVQHGPDDRVVIHQQVAFAVFRHRFRDDFLHVLRDHSDVFVRIANAHRVAGLVAIVDRLRQFVRKRYTNEEFVNILMQHVPDRGPHAMRYFGLASPRSKARLWAAIFVLLNQPQHPHIVNEVATSSRGDGGIASDRTHSQRPQNSCIPSLQYSLWSTASLLRCSMSHSYS